NVPERLQETDDEGIERDSGEGDEESSTNPHHITLSKVIDRCCNHLGASSPHEADAHYRAVCRALVAEAIELSSFLEKVSQGTQELRAKAEASSTDLDKLQFSDWSTE
ncbi:hypothetical protein L9F63_015748, partial [Diploptera punctata]